MPSKLVLLLGAVVLFILAALFAFGVGNVSTNDTLGLGFAGLAAFAGSFLVP